MEATNSYTQGSVNHVVVKNKSDNSTELIEKSFPAPSHRV